MWMKNTLCPSCSFDFLTCVWVKVCPGIKSKIIENMMENEHPNEKSSNRGKMIDEFKQ